MFQYRSKLTQSLFFILFAGFLLRICVCNDPLLHEWDEKYHALVAKNLISEPLKPRLYETPILKYEYKDWTTNHIWLHKPPLALWTMAIGLKTFGFNEIGVRFWSLLFSIASIFLTFLIARKLYNEKVGLFAAFFQAINGYVIEIAGGRSTTDHVDTMLLFLIELGVLAMLYSSDFFKQKKKSIFVLGFLMALAILCKWLIGLILLPLLIVFELFIQKNNLKSVIIHAFKVFFIAILLVSPWFLYTYLKFPEEFKWEQLSHFLHVSKSIEGHNHAWWFYLENARINWNESIYLVFAFFTYFLYKNRKPNDFLIWIWVVIPYLVFSFSSTKMTSYVLICAPAIFTMLGIFCNWLWNEVNIPYPNLKKFAVLLVFLFAIRYSYERVKPFQTFEKEIAVKNSIFQLSQHFDPTKKNLIFGNKHSILSMFYLDCISYPTFPTNEEMNGIDLNKYQIICINDGNVPDYLMENKVVEKISF
jgi:4-amino-4-deoxy-L-arabinose transferase-like glycosyltransferase